MAFEFQFMSQTECSHFFSPILIFKAYFRGCAGSLWLCRLALVVSGAALHWHTGFSLWWLLSFQRHLAAGHLGFSSRSSWALALRLSSRGAETLFILRHVESSRPSIKPTKSPSTGRWILIFYTTRESYLSPFLTMQAKILVSGEKGRKQVVEKKRLMMMQYIFKTMYQNIEQDRIGLLNIFNGHNLMIQYMLSSFQL